MFPQVNLDASKSPQAILQWHEIKKGQADGGELLFAAELFLVSNNYTDYYRVSN